ncbi:MAG: hypothetical protein M3R08_07315 [Bacteroidota bacterium]|nr:hypothetical protein [Bacteroidota bacterium]
MNQIAKSLLIVLPLILAQRSIAQSACADFHKFNCMPSSDARFSANGQSKSASVQVGKETELNVIIYRGQDYRISLCHDEKILGESLAIRIVEKIRVARDGQPIAETTTPIIDAEGNKTGTSKSVRLQEDGRVYDEIERVIWDNTEHEMAQEIEFACTATKRIAIEVNAQGTEGSKLKKGTKQYDIGCVGILIEHMTSPELGF